MSEIGSLKKPKMIVEIKGDPSDICFYNELLEIYKSNKRKINKNVYTKRESELLDFCSSEGHLSYGTNNRPYLTISYENTCKLALIFANVLGKKMPDHVHNRMILGVPNEYVKEYISYVSKLKPYRFFNTNPNKFKSHRLFGGGHLIKTCLK